MAAAIIVIQVLHFLGLVMGMGSGIALSIVGPAIAAGDERQRAALWEVQAKLSRTGHVGLGLLLVTGLLLVGLKLGGVGSVNWWFWLKMALVLVLVVSIATASSAAKRLKNGDVSAAKIVKTAGMLNAVTATAIILVAIIAFR